MADFVYNIALGRRGDDWSTATIRALLLTVKEADDTLRDYDNVGAILGGSNTETTATGYSRITDISPSAPSVDDTNNRTDFDAADLSFGALGNGTNQSIVGVETYKFVTDDAGSTPISHHDLSFTTDGSSVTIQWATAGVWRAAG
jgi:hypothetical protein